ncbi:hypothetical protein BUALT_Bualt03G0177200 [Buddleja alternifolia]|uniref:Uncharacterized protein n=1 Tax=Buddleja alternifolia TaxID=168488 RepID=A0AAV6XVW4_9LAMI|nr:hypothetical protein BUALT_Bualt03G0177200 [Buddleja alternifolia]
MHSLTMKRMNSAIIDEFKYGFPSDGLSSVSYRWWENKNAIDNGDDSNQIADKDSKEDGVAANLTSMAVEMSEGKKNEIDGDYQRASLLSDLRKKAAKDG